MASRVAHDVASAMVSLAVDSGGGPGMLRSLRVGHELSSTNRTSDGHSGSGEAKVAREPAAYRVHSPKTQK